MEDGRRTRSGRNAPVLSPVSTRKTRKSTASESDDPHIETKELVEDTAAATKDTPQLDEEQSTEQPMAVVNDQEEESTDMEDQFIHIPDGNGVANNGIEHVDEEMPDEQQETVEKEKVSAEEKKEEQSVVDTTDVAMASAEDDGTGNPLKRKPVKGEGDVEMKKQKTQDDTSESKAPVEEKEVKPPPKLPDLEKYWKPVNEDATNFTGWTYLLQYVDQETDVEAAREAYDAFLSHYPYCYGYWRKYADYEKNKGDRNKCEEVFERGLRAIPLSVDLWIHYLNYVKATHADNETLIRSQYERALDVCGLEFRSDKLWEAYIKWETEAKRLQRVVGIYDRLLATPTLGYNSHFGSFSDLVRANPPKDLLEPKEWDELKLEVERDAEQGEKVNDDEKKNEPKKAKKPLTAEELDEAIRRKVLEGRKMLHEQTVQEVTSRWTFEEGVKRPYFHVKPLERCQLKNWSDYLDYEMECGDRRRIVVLFERCLIACALYEEYWQKFVRFLSDGSGDKGVNEEELEKMTRDVYERACTIHHREKPRLHLMWSSFEECHGRIEKAAEILANIDELAPNLLQVEYRRINVERRRGNLDKCEELFRKYIVSAKSQQVASSLAIKHARFVHKMRNDLDRAMEILRAGQKNDPGNVRITLQMIDLAMQRERVDEKEVVEILDAELNREDLDQEQRVLFAQRKVEFLEDFGMNPKELQKAQKVLQAALTTLQEQKKQKSLENNEARMHPTSTVAPVPQQAQQQQYANYSYYGAGGGAGADASAYGSYSDANYWNQYGQYAGNNNYANYANYYQ